MVFQLLKSGYEKIRGSLAKARSALGYKIRELFKGKINEQTLEQLEQLLYESDLGVQTAMELTEKIRKVYSHNPQMESDELIAELQKEIEQILSHHPTALTALHRDQGPLVILIVGVNGNGKTTSVAKLANYLKKEGKKVLIAAADTFRAAAIEQLEIWAKEVNVDIVKGNPNSDPAAVVFDALTAAKARGVDAVIIDTAGRLHTRTDLMHELEKIRRACHKVHPSSPHETLLILDATTGQNAVDQAQIFHKFTPISGLVLTKFDGTAKGGIVVNIQRQLNIPVKFVGTGENLDDIAPFVPQAFTQALLG